MNKILLASLGATLALTLFPAAAKTDMVTLEKELEIMSSIMHTALRQQNGKEGIRYRSIDSTYLAEQGVVFEINTAGSGWQFKFDLGGMLSGMDIPVAPMAPHAPGDNIVIEFDEEWEHQVEELVEGAREIVRETRGKLRELRDREREIGWEERELERNLRDLEFQKRSANQEHQAELVQREQELKQRLKELQGRQAEVARYAEEIEQQQEEVAKKRNEAKAKAYKQFMAGFEANIADVMCKYGAGLKALPDSENVSFILPELGDIESNDKRDRIYVFKHADIQQCVRDKKTPNSLLKGAQTYLF